jgi:aldehyde dehydrogenase (NAD+)
VGPLINPAAVDKVGVYVDVGRAEGELVLGGAAAVDGDLQHGNFFGPTIFAGVMPMARIAQEEIFGPVLSIIPVAGYQEAATALNQTNYGWKQTGNGHREAGHAALDSYTEWKSIYVDFSGRLQRAQIDNQEQL